MRKRAARRSTQVHGATQYPYPYSEGKKPSETHAICHSPFLFYYTAVFFKFYCFVASVLGVSRGCLHCFQFKMFGILCYFKFYCRFLISQRLQQLFMHCWLTRSFKRVLVFLFLRQRLIIENTFLTILWEAMAKINKFL